MTYKNKTSMMAAAGSGLVLGVLLGVWVAYSYSHSIREKNKEIEGICFAINLDVKGLSKDYEYVAYDQYVYKDGPIKRRLRLSNGDSSMSLEGNALQKFLDDRRTRLEFGTETPSKLSLRPGTMTIIPE